MGNERYIGLFDRGYGMEAIEIMLNYPFYGSGVITPMIYVVHIDTGKQTEKPNYLKVSCILTRTREEAAHTFHISSSTLSRYLAHHEHIQKQLGQRLYARTAS